MWSGGYGILELLSSGFWILEKMGPSVLGHQKPNQKGEVRTSKVEPLTSFILLQNLLWAPLCQPLYQNVGWYLHCRMLLSVACGQDMERRSWHSYILDNWPGTKPMKCGLRTWPHLNSIPPPPAARSPWGTWQITVTGTRKRWSFSSQE